MTIACRSVPRPNFILKSLFMMWKGRYFYTTESRLLNFFVHIVHKEKCLASDTSQIFIETYLLIVH
jgi:hypothetical protein